MTNEQHADNMTLAPGVVDTIISLTASEQEGVASIGTPAGGFLARIINRPTTSGIQTRYDDNGKIEVVLHVVVEYGQVLPELADKLRQAIADALLVQVGVEVASIDVFVDGIQFGEN